MLIIQGAWFDVYDETMNFENTNKIIKQKREDDIKWLKNALDV